MEYTFEMLKDQTLKIRALCVKVAEAVKDKGDEIPAGWNNNLRWQLGHLIITPRRLTLGLYKEDLGLPTQYNQWFAKDTGPGDWGNTTPPTIEELLPMVSSSMDHVFSAMENRLNEKFPQPYSTSVGVTLTCPADALAFSMTHDAIHLGSLLALKRALVQG
jgi:DinB superfamily